MGLQLMDDFAIYYNALAGCWFFASPDGEITGTGATFDSCIEQIDALTEQD